MTVMNPQVTVTRDDVQTPIRFLRQIIDRRAEPGGRQELCHIKPLLRRAENIRPHLHRRHRRVDHLIRRQPFLLIRLH
jgi:hypothetical protein